MFLCLFGLVKFGLKGQQPVAQGNALSKMGWFDCFALKGQKNCWNLIAFALFEAFFIIVPQHLSVTLGY